MLHFLVSRFKVPDSTIDTLIQKYCTNCTICKGARTILRDGKLFKCDCLKKYNKEYVYYAAGIPKEFHNLSKDDIDTEWVDLNKDSMNRITSYSRKILDAIDQNFSLYLSGGPGSGKSFIAFLLLKQIITNGKSAYFILLRDLVSAAVDSLRDKDLANDVENLITNTDLLVLDNVDEVTAVKDRELLNTIIIALLRKRNHSGKPIIITSNCRKDELSRFIGENLTSVLTSRASEIPLIGNLKTSALTQLESDFFGE